MILEIIRYTASKVGPSTRLSSAPRGSTGVGSDEKKDHSARIQRYNENEHRLCNKGVTY